MQNLKQITQDGTKLVLKSGTQLTPSTGTQAVHIADLTALTTSGGSVTAITTINAILSALEGVGILASS